MTHWLDRSELLIGKEGLEKLQRSHVLVVGVGGVGAYAAEHLCRSGIGEMTIVDADCVEDTNRNRQLLALTSTIGQPKTQVLAQRLSDINPDLKIHTIQEFLRDERTPEVLSLYHYDYVVDAIDSLSPKVFLLYHAVQMGLKVVSVMGAGGKTDPAQIRVADIKKTYQCKLAHAIRKRLHKMGISEGFQAVFSPEDVPDHAIRIEVGENKLSTVGTVSYMPALFGAWAASVVIRELGIGN